MYAHFHDRCTYTAPTTTIWTVVFRVPLQQLALPRKRGGLNRHLPAIMAKALLTNRYVTEQECLGVGGQHISCAGNPPNIAAVSSTYPCLRIVIQQLGYQPPSDTMRANRRRPRACPRPNAEPMVYDSIFTINIRGTELIPRTYPKGMHASLIRI